MERETVEMYDLWVPCKEGDGMAITAEGKHMKLVASVVNGVVIHLEKDYFLEKRILTKEEADNLITNSRP